ncbi:PepSY-associated TM helix domain-containing protein [Methylocystis parvus]|uniref:PepSY domain-containing protein n=1 Tax=Methylocystis parvus TaxID=134 RepID=A0A6B8M4A7_9HYPH|nr:PepSY-associated TM helix domain-containing protein [Methylocystis parvus]QGM96922.1 PepSY domain-containing protein [Methylocystis parvus]WBJ99192.1 PepSY domain-containing protein [Methylocystis parvus OBBP]
MMESRFENEAKQSAPGARSRDHVRRVFLRIHQFVGLFAGAIFVLIGLSGALLAFREDIDESLNAPLMRVETPAQPVFISPDDILAAAAASMPPGAKLERLTMPRHKGAAATVGYMAETDDLDAYFYETFVDPYTAKVKGQRVSLHGDDIYSQPLIRILMAFHWTLLLGVNNAYLIGCLAIAILASVLIGVYLWLPRGGDWRLGLKVKWGASSERVVYDLHRSVGVYMAAVLLVMLATGAAMIFKPATRAAVNLFSPVGGEADFGRSAPAPGQSPIPVGAAIAAADKIFPDGRILWVSLPSAPSGVYVVGKQALDEPSRSSTFRNVGVDQYSGRVLGVQNRKNFTAGETFLEWLHPLHSGEAFGEFGRPLVFLIGLTPLLLYMTGFMRWRGKGRARRRAS